MDGDTFKNSLPVIHSDPSVSQPPVGRAQILSIGRVEHQKKGNDKESNMWLEDDEVQRVSWGWVVLSVGPAGPGQFN